MLVLLLWNWSSQAGMLPPTETHLKQPMQAPEHFYHFIFIFQLLQEASAATHVTLFLFLFSIV